MRLVAKIFAGIVLTGLVAAIGAVTWFLMDWSREISPATYVAWLDSNPAVYAEVDSISETDLSLRAYAYDQNTFANAFPGALRLPKIADAKGHVPAFRLGDDIFIVTWKWVNSSAGLAISDSPEFKTKIESIDHCFRIRHLSGNVYEWNLDLDDPPPDQNAK